MFHASTLRWRKNLTITAILCFFTGIGTTQKFSDRVLEHRDGRSTGIPADVKPCIVSLFAGLQFVNFNVPTYQYTPPSGCTAPWQKVVFTADFSVAAGRQFDRTAIVDMGFVNLYFGTTAEPRQNLAPSWHVERDVTDYNALFTNPQSGSVILGNIVNSTYTGIISGSAALEFYPADDHGSSRRVADAVVPLGLWQLLHHRQAARRPPHHGIWPSAGSRRQAVCAARFPRPL